jgi:hypothetical protein
MGIITWLLEGIVFLFACVGLSAVVFVAYLLMH